MEHLWPKIEYREDRSLTMFFKADYIDIEDLSAMAWKLTPRRVHIPNW